MYTGSLMNFPNAECDPCVGCQCQSGTVSEPKGTCRGVSGLPANEWVALVACIQYVFIHHIVYMLFLQYINPYC